MLTITRSCATIQVTVTNKGGVLVYDQSCGVEAVGHLEGMLNAAMKHERRCMDAEIANEFYERIAQLQRIISDMQNKPRGVHVLKGENIIDADFVQITDQRSNRNA